MVEEADVHMLKIVSGALAGVALLVAATVAQAQTFTWTGSNSFNDATQTFAGITANTLDINSTSGAFFVDAAFFSNVRFDINLIINGTPTNIYSTTLGGADFRTLNSLPVFSFATGTVTGIQFLSDPNTLIQNYQLFQGFLGIGSTTFTFSNQPPVAVPGPVAGAGVIPLLGLAGFWYARRRKRLAA
jgi:hypothetical protein